jgi:hypothetical protein
VQCHSCIYQWHPALGQNDTINVRQRFTFTLRSERVYVTSRIHNPRALVAGGDGEFIVLFVGNYEIFLADLERKGIANYRVIVPNNNRITRSTPETFVDVKTDVIGRIRLRHGRANENGVGILVAIVSTE